MGTHRHLVVIFGEIGLAGLEVEALLALDQACSTRSVLIFLWAWVTNLQRLTGQQGLWEEFADVLLLEAGGRADAGVTTVIKNWFCHLGYPREVSLLIILLIFGHNICQLDVAFVLSLSSIGQGMHLFNLLLQAQTFRI